MGRAEDVASEQLAQSLLERIQQLPAQSDAYAAVAGPYLQQWPAYQAAYLAAADRYRRTPARGGGASISPWFFVLATALNTTVAAVLAVLITLSVVRQDAPPQQVSRSQPIPPVPVTPPADARAAPGSRAALVRTDTAALQASKPVEVEVQPIGSPQRPLPLEALKPSPLRLHIRPEAALTEPYILVLSGIPPKADVLGADRIGTDSWLLAPESIETLQIVLPEWSAQTIELGVELRRTNGLVAARTRAWLTVPPPMPKEEPRTDKAALEEILRSADQLLSRGDIVAARSVYERAAEMGSGAAALALGSTYDPSRLWSLGVFGMVGNKDKARHWYTRADQLGHPGAKDRLKALAK